MAAKIPERPSLRRWRLVVSGRNVQLGLIITAGIMAIGIAAAHVGDVILYNESPSMPIGLYARTETPVARGAVVTVRAVEVAADYARQRNFTDAGDRFIKRVVGIKGDTACAIGDTVTLNGAFAARRQAHDSVGRRLPSWSGCRVLAETEVLLLGETEDSFDGRYWGVVRVSQIEGVWRPVWVYADHRRR